jgi:hypothetical protein
MESSSFQTEKLSELVNRAQTCLSTRTLTIEYILACTKADTGRTCAMLRPAPCICLKG